MIGEPSEPQQPSARAVAEFIERAMRDLSGLPSAKRIDFNLLAAQLLEPIDKDAAQLARHTAAFLREAELHQTSLFESLTKL